MALLSGLLCAALVVAAADAIGALPRQAEQARAVSSTDAEDGVVEKGAAVLPRVQHGLASYYGRMFDGRRTASGTLFDNDRLLAAHPSYPFGSVLRVTNLGNSKSVDVTIVDRGPAKGPRTRGVIIDLSRAAAEALDFIQIGRTRVRVEYLDEEHGNDGGEDDEVVTATRAR